LTEGIRDGKCFEIGYLRICDDIIEHLFPETSISAYLSEISECLELGKCSKGFPLSRNPNEKIVRTSPEKFLLLTSSLRGSAVGRVSSSSKTYLLSEEKIDFGELLSNNLKMLGKQIDLISWRAGAYLGIKIKDDVVVIPNTEDSLSAGQKGLFIPYKSVAQFVPFGAAYAYSIIKAYKKMLYAVDAVPKFDPLCRTKGEKVECYAYRGSSRCPFSRNKICPLRTLHRRSQRDNLGGAFEWIKFAEGELERNKEAIAYNIDYLSSAYVLKYLKSLAYILSASLKEYAGFRNWKEDEQKAIGEAEELRSLAKTSQNYRLRDLFATTAEEIEATASLPSPQKKTAVIIRLDSLPQRIRYFSRIIKNDRIYSTCRPRHLNASVVEGYVNTFFPLLRGSISKIISEKVSALLELKGCVEAEDLSNILSPELAESLLNLLYTKNLLSKRRGADGNIFL